MHSPSDAPRFAWRIASRLVESMASNRRIVRRKLSRQGLGQIRQRVRQRGNHGAVLLQLTRNHLVQRVSRGVVIIEIGPAVLDGSKGRHSSSAEETDIRSSIIRRYQYACSLGSQNIGQGLQQRNKPGLAVHEKTSGMTCSEITFDGGILVRHVIFVVRSVCSA